MGILALIKLYTLFYPRGNSESLNVVLSEKCPKEMLSKGKHTACQQNSFLTLLDSEEIKK
jgi:hypothetical protein